MSCKLDHHYAANHEIEADYESVLENAGSNSSGSPGNWLSTLAALGEGALCPEHARNAIYALGRGRARATFQTARDPLNNFDTTRSFMKEQWHSNIGEDDSIIGLVLALVKHERVYELVDEEVRAWVKDRWNDWNAVGGEAGAKSKWIDKVNPALWPVDPKQK